VIWYQGETNGGRGFQYRQMFPLMIQSWRDAWGQGDFAFYWVQLADFMREVPQPSSSAWAELREAQTQTQDKLPNTGEAVIIDAGEANDIHPRDKQTVGRRLVRLALHKTYGKSLAAGSPRYASVRTDGDSIVVKFRNVNGKLVSKDGKPVEGFAIAGADRNWMPAQAEIISDNEVRVRSDQVGQPVAVRYAWADNPVCNLFDTSALPVTPFRTESWPGVGDNNRW
jgi:sialate O-acetylesterase